MCFANAGGIAANNSGYSRWRHFYKTLLILREVIAKFGVITIDKQPAIVDESRCIGMIYEPLIFIHRSTKLFLQLPGIKKIFQISIKG